MSRTSSRRSREERGRWGPTNSEKDNLEHGATTRFNAARVI